MRKLWFICTLLLLVISCSQEEAKETIEDSNPDSEKPSEPILAADGAEIILAPKTKFITGEQIDNIAIPVTSDKIYFKKSTPSKSLPKVGQILYFSEFCEKLPEGFLGKVTGVEQNGEHIVVSTEEVTLSEAFLKLEYHNAVTDFSPDGDIATRSIDKEGFFMYKKAFDLTLKESGLSNTLKGYYAIGVRMIKDGDFVSGDFSILILVKIQNGFSMKAQVEKELKIEGDGISIPFKTSPGALFFTPTLSFKPVFTIDGSASIIMGTDVVEYIPLYLVCRDGVLTQEKYEKYTTSKPENQVGKFSLEGSASAALAVEVSFRLFGNKNNKISLEGSIGPKWEAAINFDSVKKDLYDQIKDSPVKTSVACEIGAIASLKLLKLGYEWRSEAIFSGGFAEESSYIFPSFDITNIQSSAINNVFVYCNVTRSTWLPQEIGLALFDDKKNMVGEPKVITVSYWLEDFQHYVPCEVTLTGLEMGRKFQVVPYMKLFGTTVYAFSAAKEFVCEENECPVIVKQKEYWYRAAEVVDKPFWLILEVSIDKSFIDQLFTRDLIEWGFYEQDLFFDGDEEIISGKRLIEGDNLPIFNNSYYLTTAEYVKDPKATPVAFGVYTKIIGEDGKDHIVYYTPSNWFYPKYPETMAMRLNLKNYIRQDENTYILTFYYNLQGAYYMDKMNVIAKNEKYSDSFAITNFIDDGWAFWGEDPSDDNTFKYVWKFDRFTQEEIKNNVRRKLQVEVIGIGTTKECNNHCTIEIDPNGLVYQGR